MLKKISNEIHESGDEVIAIIEHKITGELELVRGLVDSPVDGKEIIDIVTRDNDILTLPANRVFLDMDY